MNKAFFIIFFFLAYYHSLGQYTQFTRDDLIGTWKFADSTGNINFIDSAHMSITFKEITAPACTYTIDFSKAPMPITIQAFWVPNVPVKSYGLIQFINRHQIKFELFFYKAPTSEFSPDPKDIAILYK
jgi:hypothetical protein